MKFETLLVLLLAFPVLPACRSSPDSERDRARIRELEEENRRLQERVATLESRMTMILQNGATVTVCPMYPPIDGRVVEVDASLHRVVVDKGERDGVKVGYVFDVYSGATYKGQVRIQDVQETTSSGSILSEKAAIAAGDFGHHLAVTPRTLPREPSGSRGSGTRRSRA